MIQLGICFGFSQKSYTLAPTLPEINIINTRVGENICNNSSESTCEIFN